MRVIPDELAAAADDVGDIGAMLDDANAVAALRTSGILPAAADEVSAVITPLFNNQSTMYQQLAAPCAAFQQRFVQLLGVAGIAYADSEQAAQQALRDAIGDVESPFSSFFAVGEASGAPTSIPPLIVPQNGSVALVVGRTTFPLPSAHYVSSIMTNLLDDPRLSPLTGALGQPLYTPEQLWPVTPQLGNLTLGQSVAQGVQLLNSAINTELSAGNRVIVYGTSQSALVATRSATSWP